jgi:hypothetical protein
MRFPFLQNQNFTVDRFLFLQDQKFHGRSVDRLCHENGRHVPAAVKAISVQRLEWSTRRRALRQAEWQLPTRRQDEGNDRDLEAH